MQKPRLDVCGQGRLLSGGRRQSRKEVKYLKEVNSLIRSFAAEEDAVGTVEIILILVVLISLVVLFRDQLTTVVNKILKKVSTNSNAV